MTIKETSSEHIEKYLERNNSAESYGSSKDEEQELQLMTPYVSVQNPSINIPETASNMVTSKEDFNQFQ